MTLYLLKPSYHSSFQMKYYYISSKKGLSGICKYSGDFYELVLKPKGFIFIDSSENLSVIFTKVSSRDYIHIEIGIFQNNEIEILLLMIKAKYKNISVTLHDAPLLKYPVRQFNNSYLNKISKFYDRFINNHKNVIPYIKNIKSIFVLTHKAVEKTKQLYKIDNVYYLPHVIDPCEIESSEQVNKNFLYFGFIGKNKGIEYSLKLHEAVIKVHKTVQFYILGTALAKQVKFYNYLKKKYTRNVHFLGYVPEEDLLSVYEKATFALILFKKYRFFCPVSGSILHSLKMGKVVLTNNVNAIPEIIGHRKNGIYLTGNLTKDLNQVLDLYNNPALLKEIQHEAFNYIYQHHSPEKVSDTFFKICKVKNEIAI